jgi:hypothetical protein
LWIPQYQTIAGLSEWNRFVVRSKAQRAIGILRPFAKVDVLPELVVVTNVGERVERRFEFLIFSLQGQRLLLNIEKAALYLGNLAAYLQRELRVVRVLHQIDNRFQATQGSAHRGRVQHAAIERAEPNAAPLRCG